MGCLPSEPMTSVRDSPPVGLLSRPFFTSVLSALRSRRCDCNTRRLGVNTPAPGLFRADGGVASNRAPQPFENLSDHIAEQQPRRRPDQRRYPIVDLKAPTRHLNYPPTQRHPD